MVITEVIFASLTKAKLLGGFEYSGEAALFRTAILRCSLSLSMSISRDSSSCHSVYLQVFLYSGFSDV